MAVGGTLKGTRLAYKARHHPPHSMLALEQAPGSLTPCVELVRGTIPSWAAIWKTLSAEV